MKKNILFVDDEKQILRAVKRFFIQKDFDVFLADSGEEALKILENEDIHLIISDVRMPKMDGFELLKRVKEKYPATLRLILSGYVEENLVLKAIQNGLAKMYLTKPWDNEKLLETIERIFELEDILNHKDLLAVLNKMEGLPTILKIYNKLQSYIKNDRDIKEIAEIIEMDQSIAARVLHVANSAFYGVQTGSVQKAIVYLGLANIKNIVFTTSIFEASQSAIKSTINKEMYWQHANLTNKITNFLYEKVICKKLPHTYGAAGLLHDIGKIALLNYFVNCKKVFPNSDSIKSLEDIENAVNVPHEKLGGCLLNWWEIPYPIVESALYHHNPLDDKIINKEIVCVVHIANYYSWELLGRPKDINLAPKVFKYLGIEKEFCDESINNYRKDLIREGGKLHIAL